MDGSVYPNKDVVAASKRWVNIYCNKDTEHGTKKVGNEEFCALIPGIRCEEHVAAWNALNNLYFKGSIPNPTTIWCDVDGTEVGRQEGSMVAKDMISKFAAAEKKVGPGLNVDEYNYAMGSIADGAKSEEAGKIPDAVKSYAAVVRMKNPAAKNVIQLAQDAMNKLDAAGRVKVSAAKEIIAGRDYERAKSILKEVLTTYKGLPVAKEAEAEYSDLIKREELEKKNGLKNPGSTR